MCNFISLVATKSGKIYGDGTTDGHTDILNQNKDKDKELIERDNRELSEEENILKITFALVEVVPEDKDIFDLKPKNWKVIVDQPRKPAWWDREIEKKCHRQAMAILKKQVIVGGEYEELDRDVRFVENTKIKILKSKIGEMYGSSRVGEMYGSSQVGEMYGSSQVGKMYDSSQVGKMYDSSQVGEMYGSSQVGKMYDSSQVKEAKENNTINIWSKDASVIKQSGGKSVVIKRYLKNVKVEIK
jgi:hypothetical protein